MRSRTGGGIGNDQKVDDRRSVIIGNETGKTAKPKPRVTWHKIRAEYIQGVSQVKLAKKYGVSRTTVAEHCRREGWTQARRRAQAEIEQKVTQKTAEKTAEAVASNATLAENIKRKLLQRLDRILDTFPEDDATEVQKYSKSKRRIYKLKDLTAMYKDLTSDMTQTDEAGNELLASLLELERRATGD